MLTAESVSGRRSGAHKTAHTGLRTEKVDYVADGNSPAAVGGLGGNCLR